MKQHNHGCVSFTYGEDVYHEQALEDLEHMNISYEIGLNLKGKMVINQEHAYHEAFEAITMEIDQVSESVIRHKIKRLQPHQLKELFLDFILFKIEQKDIIDDYKIHETVEQTKARLMKKF